MTPSGCDTPHEWLRLQSVPGIGNRLYHRLLERFGTAEAVFSAPDMELLGIKGITARLVEFIRIQRLPDKAKESIETCRQKGYRIVTYNDPSYPSLLKQIPDPPPLLYLAGTLPAPAEFLAVVGTRNPTEDGVAAARTFSRDLTQSGLIVTSGMARGIDTAAHEGALEVAGVTVAVMGSGLDRVYPPENRHLFDRIRENGAVITEFPPSSPPDPHHFPLRNRIISGMSRGTLVVEAGKKSGALITATLALEQNREVFAVPGGIRSYKSYGTNLLIRQGAKLVVHAGDVIEEIFPMLAKPPVKPAGNAPPPPDLTSEEKNVLRSLGPGPMQADDLARTLGIAPGLLSMTLLQLELKGLVQQMAGQRYVKK